MQFIVFYAAAIIFAFALFTTIQVVKGFRDHKTVSSHRDTNNAQPPPGSTASPAPPPPSSPQQ